MTLLKTYIRDIYEIARRGDATEESYYSALKDLLCEYAAHTRKQHINITILPKKTEAGNPDFRVWDGKQHIVGYIEAKDLSRRNLDEIESSAQLKRYRQTFPNSMLTNFFEFRLYRNGELINRASIGRQFVIDRLKQIPPIEQETEFLKLLDTFFAFSLPRVYEAKTLAVELAKRTRFLREVN